MLASSGMMAAGHGWGSAGGGQMMGGPGYGGMHTWTWRHGYMQHYWGGAWPPWAGIAAAVLVIAGAAVVYSTPRSSREWGVVVLIASAVALVTGSGIVPGVLGIVGGILALTWRPERR
jgi:hypothetical protein